MGDRARAARVTYVALLRGINVGGNRTVGMKPLKALFERLGLEEVRTYINSGNVIFASTETPAALRTRIESAIEEEFGFPVAVMLRSAEQIRALVDEMPDDWANGEEAKCDVMFLGDDVVDVMSQITVKPEIDDVRHPPGALLWRVPRHAVTRSGMMRIVGSELYAHMTVRNCNTLRKLDALMRSDD